MRVRRGGKGKDDRKEWKVRDGKGRKRKETRRIERGGEGWVVGVDVRMPLIHTESTEYRRRGKYKK